MKKIESIKAREILDSRGEPTVEVEIESGGKIFRAQVPSGTSEGKYEAVELRDGGKRFFGRGVLGAVKNIEEIIAPKLTGESVANQKKIDEILIELDGTPDKSKLGTNAILPVSVACLCAGAAARNMPLYRYISEICNFSACQCSGHRRTTGWPARNVGRSTAGWPARNVGPAHKASLSDAGGRSTAGRQSSIPELPRGCFNVLNGGAHAGSDLDIQEFMIIPQMAHFKESLRAAGEIYHSLKKILEKKFGKFSINVGYEGGFVPPLKKTKEALDLIMEAVGEAGYSGEIKLALDCAASEFFRNGAYEFEEEKKGSGELLAFYQGIIKEYPILFLEDPFSQDDWPAFQKITAISGKECLIIGDDLLATNPKRVEEAYQKGLCSGAILKPDQIGTVSEVIEVARLAKEFGWTVIVSHRSGDTCDDFIADLAVGVGAGFIKAGAPARGERIAKYNRLLRIEEQICTPLEI